MLHKKALECGSEAECPSGRSSRVRSVLQRCHALRKEIESEKQAASDLNGVIVAHDLGEAGSADLKAIAAIARSNPQARIKLKKTYQTLIARIANEQAAGPDLTTSANPVIPVVPSHSTRRHFKHLYDTQGGSSLLKEVQ